VKNWQRFLIEKAATEAKNRLERSEKNELLNLFNSGIVVDIKKLKIKGIEIGLKIMQNIKKGKGV
jgi:hypothetical protein